MINPYTRLWATVVPEALVEAREEYNKRGMPALHTFDRWLRSRDGREVLQHAGIDPNPRVVKKMLHHVQYDEMVSVRRNQRVKTPVAEVNHLPPPPPPPPPPTAERNK